MLDLTFKNNIPASTGKVLVADPFEGDEYFERSVVLLCSHSEEGSFGFIINNIIEVNMKDLNDNFIRVDLPVSKGGPVERDSLFFIHTLGNKMNNSQHLGHGIYIGADFQQLYEMIENDEIQEHQIRFFIGYSGWSKGQLEEEIEQNAWVVADIDHPDEIMKIMDEDPWHHFMKKLGKKYEIMTNFPINPNNN